MAPAAMAGVVASVASGQTTVPWMVASLKPVYEGTPLAAEEAAQLQRLLRATVTSGLASTLQGIAVGAKSGTAEYGDPGAGTSHAWMIAYTDHDVAAAVWVQDGGGAGTAGPVIRQLLS
jgi:cell division protein FtsI/penicillin-binding protein 2